MRRWHCLHLLLLGNYNQLPVFTLESMWKQFYCVFNVLFQSVNLFSPQLVARKTSEAIYHHHHECLEAVNVNMLFSEKTTNKPFFAPFSHFTLLKTALQICLISGGCNNLQHWFSALVFCCYFVFTENPLHRQPVSTKTLRGQFKDCMFCVTVS